MLTSLVAEEPPPFPNYKLAGVGEVIAHEGDSYIVRMADGRVCGFRAANSTPSEDFAAIHIAAAIANPVPPTPAVPPELTRPQFVIALRRVLKLTEGDVFALISQLPAGETQETARDLWENAQTFHRTNSFLTALAQLNGNTPEQIDEVFRVGAALDLT